MRFSLFPPLWSLALALLATMGAAEEKKTAADPARGHSYHGEAFNEGPRQTAVLLPGTGNVHFPVTTTTEEAQRFFDQGVGQLHGFWDFEAERSFRQVAALDPDCAMAYWGMAMANFGNKERGKGFADEAAKRRAQAGPVEQMWIDGIAAYFKDPKADEKKRLREFVRSLETIAAETAPDNLEAEAFLLKQLYYNSRKGHPFPSHYAVNLLARSILDRAPHHPANHYRIHLWDHEKPANALDAAAQCGPSAPGIAHMWHMPGHIYSRLHRYSDAVWQQIASARVDHAHMMRFRLVPDQIGNFAHNNEWCIRNLNHLGRVEEAVALAENMIALPRLAKFKEEKGEQVYQPSGTSWHYGRLRLRETLFRFELWDRVLALTDSPSFAPDGTTLTDLDHHKYTGIARFESGDHAGGLEHLAALEAMLSKETAAQDDAVTKAETKAREAGKNDKQVEEARKAAAKTLQKAVDARRTRVDELKVYAALTATPPDPAAALEILPRLKNLAQARHAWLWHRAGHPEKAIELAAKAVKDGPNEVHPLAIQVAILHAAGKTAETEEAFAELRRVAGEADPDLPTLRRLEPVARSLDLPASWPQPSEPAKDLGPRPALDSLGPFTWSPPAAPDFDLPDATGARTRLSTRSGRATLLIFYLGSGCVHCMEQLQAFAPRAEDFAAAGVDILAVSTDSPAGLAETFLYSSEEQEDERNPFPFPLLSDENLATFKAYRAHDDFEGMPLHGTFLVDAEGRIRWQEIGFEPFVHVDFLLEECRRLQDLGITLPHGT